MQKPMQGQKLMLKLGSMALPQMLEQVLALVLG
jgi:hypothetical protein